MPKHVLEINGNAFDDLDGFYDEITRKLLLNESWGRNLNAFNDVLRGGFGTPDGGFILRWLNSNRSRSVLGYPETIRCLQKSLDNARHPSSANYLRGALESACRREGPTLFEVHIEIIRDHGFGGTQEEDGIELELE